MGRDRVVFGKIRSAWRLLGPLGDGGVIMIRLIVLTTLLFGVPHFAEADLASEGRDCYQSGQIGCATDKLIEHFQATGRSMLKPNGAEPNDSAQTLIQSLILYADNTPPGSVLSRVEVAIEIVNSRHPKTIWFRNALHTLRAEQCAAISNAACLTESRRMISENGSNWMLPRLKDSRMGDAFKDRVMAQYGG